MTSAIAIQNATVIDGLGNAPVSGQTVVITGGVIKEVGPNERVSIPASATTFDATDHVLMPGLIDAHTHLTYHKGEYALLLQQMLEPLEFNTLKAGEAAEHILTTGCTAIGDGGTRGSIASAVRDGVKRGVLNGPKVVAAGQFLTGSGGIQDNTPTVGDYDDHKHLGTVVNGPLEVRTAVRKQVRMGVDWVKVTASGTPGNPWIGGKTQDLSYEEIKAAVEEARKFGKYVHAHAHDRQGIVDAARAGVISLHSGEFADRETLQVLKEENCYFVATVAWLQFRTNPDYVERYLRLYSSTTEAEEQRFIDECREGYESAVMAIKMAYEMGVPLAIGTDAAHVFPPFDMVAEMVQHQELGIPAIDVIRAATTSSAHAIGKGEEWGSVTPGKSADLLLTYGIAPHEDVSGLLNKDAIVGIMRDGEWAKGPVPVTSAASTIAEGQLTVR